MENTSVNNVIISDIVVYKLPSVQSCGLDVNVLCTIVFSDDYELIAVFKSDCVLVEDRASDQGILYLER